jgi:NAD(P)-dependent dehydrogenase (short-subunit alcohol dehydrogenase family)
MASHLAVEEPGITSITIGPGRVDTDMQATLRLKGKDTMDKTQHQSFVDAFEQGALLKPEQPGTVIAKFVAEPSRELSGKYLV